MKPGKKPVDPVEIEVIEKFYRYKSSIDKIDRLTKALNSYHTKCENATKNLSKILKEFSEKSVRHFKKPQDPVEIEVITKYYRHKTSVDKIEQMIKALDTYHTRCGNAAKALVKSLEEFKKKPVKRLKVRSKRNLKKK